MNNILKINPEEFLENSTGRIFMIVLTTTQGTYFCLPGGTIQLAESGTMNSPAIERNQLVKEYYAALSNARSLTFAPEGRLDIVELPSFPAK